MHHQRYIRHGNPMVKHKRGTKPKNRCTFLSCKRTIYQNGYCSRHYIDSNRKAGAFESCSFPACDNKHVARGFCNSHYRQWLKFIRYFNDVYEDNEYLRLFDQEEIFLVSSDLGLLHKIKSWGVVDAYFVNSRIVYFELNEFLNYCVHPNDVGMYRSSFYNFEGDNVWIQSKPQHPVKAQYLLSKVIPFQDKENRLIRINIMSVLSARRSIHDAPNFI